jgi:hypothetical protein
VLCHRTPNCFRAFTHVLWFNLSALFQRLHFH